VIVKENLSASELIELGMHLTFESKITDKQLWRDYENTVLDNLHFYDINQVSQLAWISTSSKPKRTTGTFDNTLLNLAL